MSEVEVRTQAELDAALSRGDRPVLVGNGRFEISGSATVRASDSATVSAWDSATVSASDSATVRAWGSATVSAWDSATVRASGSATVSAWGSATVRAWGSATVSAWDSATVRASGSATVSAWGSATVSAWGVVHVFARGACSVVASALVTVTILSSRCLLAGGHQVSVPDPTTGATWCDYRGVDVVEGVATLYKAVDADWRSPHGVFYTPGTTPEAVDWEGGAAECGGGLHFFAHPWEADAWNADWRHIVACPVRIDDIAAHGFDATYPGKCKARRVCAPTFEVDIHGNRVESAGAAKPKRTRTKVAK